MKHAKMWEYTGRPGQLFRPQNCAWAGAAPQDVLCAAFLPCCVDGSVDAMADPVQVFLLSISCASFLCLHSISKHDQQAH